MEVVRQARETECRTGSKERPVSVSPKGRKRHSAVSPHKGNHKQNTLNGKEAMNE